ncbi:MAG: extracellular solute-binding protein [Chloroflexota bacterium]|nr:extracellular solute-binding protein [Chloroflexota bacterium]
MKSRRVLLIVLLVMSVALTSLGAVVAQEPVTIDWWHIFTVPPELTDFMQTLADEYMAANPNVTINITVLENEAFKERLPTVMQAGDPPDLFQSWGGGPLWTFGEAGLLRDLTPELDANDGEWRNTYSSQAALNLFGTDGEIWGVPWNFGGVGIWYNKELFAQAGIDALPATWSEFLAVVQQLKDAGITPLSVGQSEKWPGHFWYVYLAIREGGQAGFEAAYNRDGSFADAPFVAAGQDLLDLIALEPFQEGFLGMGYGQASGLMGNGEVAMELMGHWAPGAQRGNSISGEGLAEGNLGWFPFPAVEGGMGGATDLLGGGDGLAFGVNAPDEAIDFAKFLTSADVQRRIVALETGWLPTAVGANDAVTDPLLGEILAARDAAGYYQSYYDQFLPPAVAQAVLDAVDGLFNGTLTADEAAQQIEDVASFEL